MIRIQMGYRWAIMDYLEPPNKEQGEKTKLVLIKSFVKSTQKKRKLKLILRNILGLNNNETWKKFAVLDKVFKRRLRM